MPLDMSGPDDSGHSAFNCWWPMPFARRARISVSNEGGVRRALYFYVDYEQHDKRTPTPCAFTPSGAAPTPARAGWHLDRALATRDVNAVPNLDGLANYVILDATGRGHYVGCNLSIDNHRGDGGARATT